MARLEHGEHALSVRYRALADRIFDPLRYPAHQIAYVFGTTSPWAAFERLAVEVLVPPTWEAASSLPLERRQDRLVGTFAGLPGASFGLAVRRPVPAWAALLPLWPWLGGLAGLLVAVLCARTVALRRERVRPWVCLAVGAVLLAFAVSAGIAALFAWAAARFAAHVRGAAGLVPPPSVLVAYPLSVGGLSLLAGCVGALLVLVARQGQDPATGQDRTTGY